MLMRQTWQEFCNLGCNVLPLRTPKLLRTSWLVNVADLTKCFRAVEQGQGKSIRHMSFVTLVHANVHNENNSS